LIGTIFSNYLSLIAENLFYLSRKMTHKAGAGIEMESIIITTKPNESASPVHDRMPLII